MSLRQEGEFWDGDARRSYGTNKSQQAMDSLLYSWAERTWDLPDIYGKTFAMRVAANLSAHVEQDPQADWKRSANGKERMGQTKGNPDKILETVASIADSLLLSNGSQYVTMCLNYGAFKYQDKVALPTHKKAEYLGIEEGAYRKRISRIRRYFVEEWPDGLILR